MHGGKDGSASEGLSADALRLLVEEIGIRFRCMDDDEESGPDFPAPGAFA